MGWREGLRGLGHPSRWGIGGLAWDPAGTSQEVKLPKDSWIGINIVNLYVTFNMNM